MRSKIDYIRRKYCKIVNFFTLTSKPCLLLINIGLKILVSGWNHAKWHNRTVCFFLLCCVLAVVSKKIREGGQLPYACAYPTQTATLKMQRTTKTFMTNSKYWILEVNKILNWHLYMLNFTSSRLGLNKQEDKNRWIEVCLDKNTLLWILHLNN